VEIAPQAQPPVCRIMDFGKYKYEMEKKQRLAKKHQTATKMKEIQFHPSVADHDYQTKVRHILEFLEEGHRVKVALYFRGRESAHQDLGFDLVNRVIRDTSAWGTTENPPKLLGRSIVVVLTPKPKSKQQRPKDETRVQDGPRLS
jgi:translation initiation factor IF-3